MQAAAEDRLLLLAAGREDAGEQLGLGKSRMDSVLIRAPFNVPLHSTHCSHPTCLGATSGWVKYDPQPQGLPGRGEEMTPMSLAATPTLRLQWVFQKVSS